VRRIHILEKIFLVVFTFLLIMPNIEITANENIDKRQSIKQDKNNNVSNQNLNGELLEYRIRQIELQIDKIITETKSLSSNIETMNSKIENNSGQLNSYKDIYDKVLESANSSYLFLKDMLIYIISGFFFILVIVYYIFNSKFPNWLKKKVNTLVNEMSKDGFSSEIDKWMDKENKKIDDELTKFDSKYTKEENIVEIIKTDLKTNKYTTKHKEIQELLKNEDLENAKIKLDDALDNDPSDYTIKVLFSQYYLLKPDYQLAINYLNLAVKEKHEDYFIYHLLGLAHIAINADNKIILDYLQKSIQHKSQILFDYIFTGKQFLIQNNIVQASHILVQANLIFSNEILIYSTLGKIYCEIGNIGQAKEMLEKIKYLDSQQN
jgi:hypothetical protein